MYGPAAYSCEYELKAYSGENMEKKNNNSRGNNQNTGKGSKRTKRSSRISHRMNFLLGDKRVTFFSIAVGVAAILLGVILKFAFNADFFLINAVPFFKKLHQLGDDNGLTLYLSQLSFTFITISVMSVLSDSSVVIYWENIVKKKLIEPVWSCFHAYTTYSFATVLFGGIAALIGLPFIFLTFFVVDIFVLMALTFSMIDVYFRHEEKATKLEKEFRELVSFSDESFDVLKTKFERYLKITGKLRTNTILALRNYDSTTIEENLRFYARNAEYIPKRDFETIMKCVDEINVYDYIEWIDYYASVSYKDGKIPECNAQYYIREVMCGGENLFFFIFDKNVLPVFAQYSDSVSGERLFCDYKVFMKKQRDALKEKKGDSYDRRKDSPATSYTRELLLEALLEVFKRGNRDFLLSFLRAFEETNMLSNYDYIESDEYIWEKFFESFPEENAEDILEDIYPITEILYGMKHPDCVKNAAEHVFGSFDDVVLKFVKEGSQFLKDEDFDEYEPLDDDEFLSEDEYLSEDEFAEAQTEDAVEEEVEEEEDEWEYYCKIYGQEYMGWPPENDKYGFFTYAGRMAYFTSSQHGEMQDGDLPRDEFGMRM